MSRAAQHTATVPPSRTSEAFARRSGPSTALADDAEAIAATCHAMARAFHRGGRLLAFGSAGSVTDAAHVVVEFVHPVIMGKGALPAVALTGPGLAGELALVAEPADIALAVCADVTGDADREVAAALAEARARGLLTVALLGGDGGRVVRDGLADHPLVVASADPLVVTEVQVTTYHVLWELVHVFLDRPGLLS